MSPLEQLFASDSTAETSQPSAQKPLEGTASFRAVIEELENSSLTKQERGRRFERLMLQYFRKDPWYSKAFTDVRLWNDWEDKPQGWPDLGVDIVAKLADSIEGESDWCAIQCKFYAPKNKIAKPDLDKFLGASEWCRQRIFVSTSDFNKNAAKIAQEAKPHLTHITAGMLAQAKMEWATQAEQIDETKYVGEPYTPRADQLAAIMCVMRNFYGTKITDLPREWQEILSNECPDMEATILSQNQNLVDRGQMHMPCGTGKTFTALKLCEQAVRQRHNKNEPFRVLYLMPSISLLQQNMREWAEQQDPSMSHRYIGVCSDRTAGKHRNDVIGDLTQLEGEVTTNPQKIAERLTKQFNDVDLLVVFSTYQSSELTSLAQNPTNPEQLAAPSFDLIICDEAHRTSGVETASEITKQDSEQISKSGFLLPHKDEHIKAAKRLYMTATPRVYLEGAKTKAAERKASIYSMDDTNIFGEVQYRMSFLKAINLKLLSNYKIIAITIDPTYKRFLLDHGMLEKFKGEMGEKLDLDQRAKAIGTVKALTGGDDNKWEFIPTSIAFSNLIKDSKILEEALPSAADRLEMQYPEKSINLKVKHIDGTTTANIRRQRIEWLGEPREKDNIDEYRMLTNARCLSEGVDVPSLDGALFLAPKHSPIDIVQQVGRVMRKSKGKNQGYIVIPILLADEATPEERIRNSGDYQTILKVVRALKSHDDELADLLNIRSLGGKIEVRNITAYSENLTDSERKDIQYGLAFSTDKMLEAIKVCLYDEVSDKEYWRNWAQDIGEETQKLQKAVVKHLRTKYNKPLYNQFLENCRETISPDMTDQQAVGMLAQHLVTKPVFEALYSDYDFAANNNVSQVMGPVCNEIIEAGLLEELQKKTEPFYSSVLKQAETISEESLESKHELVKHIYETFIKTAMPEMAEQQGVVYTPVQIVDWLVRSADDALRQEFGLKLEDENVEILDPFAGTGTFLTRLIQMKHTHKDESGRTHLIASSKLRHKYEKELSAIEIMPTAYHIADINIEEAFNNRMSELDNGHEYVPYNGIALGNTLRMPTQLAQGETFRATMFPENINDINTPQLNRIARKNVQVIVGNPPWRAWKKPKFKSIPNDSHPEIEELITHTYAKKSTANNKNALYDLYLKSLRWVSSRIGEAGIITFVTNGGWLDGSAASGVRACLAEEFTSVYVYNLKGNLRNYDADEGGNVFNVRVPVTMIVLVKNPQKQGSNKIYYAETNSGATAAAKLVSLEASLSFSQAKWSEITPDSRHDWVNQTDKDYQKYFDLGNKTTKAGKENTSTSIFRLYSSGLKTGRDLWAYDSDMNQLKERSSAAVSFFHSQIAKEKHKNPEERPEIMKWHGDSRKALERKKTLHTSIPIRKTIFRPFYPQYVHYEKGLNHRHYQLDKIFPSGAEAVNLVINIATKGAIDFDALMTAPPPPDAQTSTYLPGEPKCSQGSLTGLPNLAICVMDKVKLSEVSVLMVNTMPDLEVVHHNQVFPLYHYIKQTNGNSQGGVFDQALEPSPVEGYVMEDNILDKSLADFRDHYQDHTITKDNIFFYCYGILHHPGFKTKYRNDLTKALPKIPYAPDFWAFVEAGKRLGELHVGYEQLEGYDLEIATSDSFDPDNDEHWKFGKKKQRLSKPKNETDIVTLKVNEKLTITGIPSKALKYKVNGKTALGWLADRYRIHIDTENNTGIVNDANKLFDNPRDYLKLVKQITEMSIQTIDTIDTLPTEFEPV